MEEGAFVGEVEDEGSLWERSDMMGDGDGQEWSTESKFSSPSMYGG